MKKILQITFAIFLANVTLTLGQTIQSSPFIVNGPTAPTLRIQTSQAPDAYFTEIVSPYDGAQPFILKVGWDKLLGIKRIMHNKGNYISYINGRYGIGFTTETGEPDSTNLKMFIASNGNVGIGTFKPSQKLQVAGTISIAPISNSESRALNFMASDGSNAKYASIETNSTSGNLQIKSGGFNSGLGFSTSFFTDDIERMKILPNGNVGIGNSTPETKLHVTGDVTMGRSDGSKWYFQTPTSDLRIVGATPAHLSLLPQGYVGIGTITPTNTLTVDSKTTNSGLTLTGLKSTVTNVQAGANRPIAVNDLGEIVLLGGAVGTGDIWTKSGDNIYRNAGNVGIGTTTPSTKLDVGGTITTGGAGSTEGVDALSMRYSGNETINNWGSLRSSSASYMGFGVKASSTVAEGLISSTTINIGRAAMTIGSNGGGFQFATASPQNTSVGSPISLNPVMSITNAGNVGIGTTNPTALLQISTRTKFNADGTVNWGQAFDGGLLSWDTGKAIVAGMSGKALSLGSDGGADKVFISTNGNVGIGTTNPTAKLDVNGTADFTNSILLSGGSGTTANKIGFNADASNYYIQGITNGMQYSPFSVGNFSFTSGNGNWNFANGSVGIGVTTMPTGFKLVVAGDMIAERVVVKLQSSGWPDYVFTPTYHLSTLPEVEKYINQNHHLPNIPSAQEVADKGIDVGAMNTKMMEKIEELTLYLIEQNKKLEALEKKNAELENAIKNIKK